MSTDRTRGVLEGRVEFPHPVYFLGECLGLVSSIVVGKVKGEVALPTAPSGGEEHDLQPPTIASQAVLDAIPGKPEVEWGYRGDAEKMHFVAQRCYTRFPLVGNRDEVVEAAQLTEYLINFTFDCLWDWVEVMTGQDVYPYERPTRERPQGSLNSLFLFTDDEAEGQLIERREGIWMWPWPVDQSMGIQHWRLALKAASSGSRPREDLLILRDAHAALVREHFRRAVIDAGSAVEMALTLAIRRELQPNNDAAVIDALLRSNEALSRRASLAKSFGVDVPGDLDEALIQPRNAAVHRGIEPSPLQAMLAVSCARKFVNSIRQRREDIQSVDESLSDWDELP